jgi:exopolysaccharide production protein ExoZ
MNKNLPYLQIARGIAALIVVLHHITGAEFFYFNVTTFHGFFLAGWNSLDFFFVLSGFIIYYVHDRDLGQKARWKRYFSKRFVRIYPIYWLIALAALTMILAGNETTTKASLAEIGSNPAYITRSLLLIPQSTMPFLVVSWSLCYEVFFYLVFGLAIVLGRRTLWIAAACYLVLFGFRLIYPNVFQDSVALSFFSSNYHIEFILGILTAWCFKAGLNIRRGWIIGLVLFAAAWAVSFSFEGDLGKFSLNSRLVYGCISGLIILSIARLSIKKENALGRFLMLLGDASYTLYLIHPIVLAILFKGITRVGVQGDHPWVNYTIFPIALGLCILASVIVHAKIERPILQFFNKPSQKKRSAIIQAKNSA